MILTVPESIDTIFIETLKDKQVVELKGLGYFYVINSSVESSNVTIPSIQHYYYDTREIVTSDNYGSLVRVYIPQNKFKLFLLDAGLQIKSFSVHTDTGEEFDQEKYLRNLQGGVLNIEDRRKSTIGTVKLTMQPERVIDQTTFPSVSTIAVEIDRELKKNVRTNCEGFLRYKIETNKKFLDGILTGIEKV